MMLMKANIMLIMLPAATCFVQLPSEIHPPPYHFPSLRAGILQICEQSLVVAGNSW